MGLFWKIFVSFMVAITVTLFGSMYMADRSANFDFLVELEGAERIHTEMQNALYASGESGLIRWLGENPRPAPNTIVLVWEVRQGPWWLNRDLIGRPMPWALERYLDTTASFRGRPTRSMDAPPAPITPTLQGNRGKQYRYMFTKAPVLLFGNWSQSETLFAIGVIALVAGGATSLGLAAYLAFPIIRVQRASRALAAGALSTRVGAAVARRKDEVGALARDFDLMAERIQALVTDKETLLRDVSHELRSPLARMRVALALAQRKVSDAAQPNLARIELEAERLDALVGQVMTLSRLRTATEPIKKPLQVEEVVASVVDDARFEHPERIVDYTAPPPIHFTGDPDGLKSAVENVLRNAFAYSPADKPIDVAVERKPSAIEIRIRDRGPGVEPRHLQRIFEPFYRTDESRDHRQDGQGIGLAITAQVMELHGGSVEAANCSDGGLQVTFRLPVERAQSEGERGRKRAP